MVSDPPTPTKNDMILFSGVLEVACHGSRYDPDYATIQIASFAIMIRKRQFNLQGLSIHKEVWGILKQRFNLSVLDLVSTTGSIYSYWWTEI